MGEAAQHIVDDDTDFEIGLRFAQSSWTDGAEAIGTALADGGAVEGIVRDADIVNDGVTRDVAGGVVGGNAASGVGDDDAQGAGHAQVDGRGRAWDRIARVDPGVRGFEIENRGKRWRRYGAQGFAKVESDTDDGHKKSIEDGRLSPRILGKAEHVRKDSICARDALRELAIKRVSVVNVDALAVLGIEQAAALFGLPFIMRFEER